MKSFLFIFMAFLFVTTAQAQVEEIGKDAQNVKLVVGKEVYIFCEPTAAYKSLDTIAVEAVNLGDAKTIEEHVIAYFTHVNTNLQAYYDGIIYNGGDEFIVFSY